MTLLKRTTDKGWPWKTPMSRGIVRLNQFLELARDMIALEREVYQRVMNTP